MKLFVFCFVSYFHGVEIIIPSSKEAGGVRGVYREIFTPNEIKGNLLF